MQAKAKLSDADIAKLRKSYLLQIKGMVGAHKIPSQLVINWDQAGVKLVPSSNWTLEQEGRERVEITGLNDKQPHLQVHSQGTYFHCKSCTKERLRGAILPRRSLMASTYGMHQTIGPMKEPHFIHRECHSTIHVCKKLPTPDQVALVIFDVFKGHTCDSVHTLFESNRILQVHVPNTVLHSKRVDF